MHHGWLASPLLCGFLIASPDIAAANCPVPEAERWFAAVDIIFRGRVMRADAVRPGPAEEFEPYTIATYSVDETLKGDPVGEIEVRFTGALNPANGFAAGDEQLVFAARRSGGPTDSGPCGFVELGGSAYFTSRPVQQMVEDFRRIAARNPS